MHCIRAHNSIEITFCQIFAPICKKKDGKEENWIAPGLKMLHDEACNPVHKKLKKGIKKNLTRKICLCLCPILICRKSTTLRYPTKSI